MKKLIFCLSLLLVGCVNVQHIRLLSEFDKDKTEEMMGKGSNTIKGSAFLRQNGGGVVTCAGLDVVLIPATAYAKERFSALYGVRDTYFFNLATPYKYNKSLSPDYPEYKLLQKTIKCDASGNFVFNDVADGEFFVQADVHWRVGSSYQGGLIAKKIKVTGGEIKEMLLTVD